MTPHIEPEPTDEEAAAVVAAIEALWPQPSGAASPPRFVSPVWRFSGRWWSGATARRSRP